MQGESAFPFLKFWPQLIQILSISRVLNTQIASADHPPWECNVVLSWVSSYVYFVSLTNSVEVTSWLPKCLCFKVPVTEFLPEVEAGVRTVEIQSLYYDKFQPWTMFTV